jgi:hypothetical protein
MGIWSWLVTGEWGAPASRVSAVVSPFASQDSLENAIVGELFGVDPTVITRETAMRVPGLKRAVQIHADVVSAMPLMQYSTGGVKVSTQPRWLQSSDSGVPPLIRTKGLVRDLALEGHGLLGCALDGEEYPVDGVHIPTSMWKLHSDGTLTVNPAVSARFTQRLIYIPLGVPGILTDGIDTIRQARALDLARIVRLSSPPAGTELHIENSQFDGMTRKEKEKLATQYAQQRQKTTVSVTPSYVKVNEHGKEAVDLFADATNSIRLDIANHASVPASAIEGAPASGGSDMTYTGKGDERSELYDLGSRQFADAIAARLSADDVCPVGEYIAFDTSNAFAIPTPTTPPVLED